MGPNCLRRIAVSIMIFKCLYVLISNLHASMCMYVHVHVCVDNAIAFIFGVHLLYMYMYCSSHVPLCVDAILLVLIGCY